MAVHILKPLTAEENIHRLTLNVEKIEENSLSSDLFLHYFFAAWF